MQRFPDIVAHDLEGARVHLPDDLPPGPRVLLLAFERDQQSVVDAWKSGLGVILEGCPELTVWEVPVLPRRYLPVRPYIDGGMRAGIPDPSVRTHTLTAYTDVRALVETLGLPGTEDVHVVLLDGEGHVALTASGSPDRGKLAELASAIMRER